jgi:hypothetical protein
MVVQGRGWEDVNWIDEDLEIFKGRDLVNAVMKLIVYQIRNFSFLKNDSAPCSLSVN